MGQRWRYESEQKMTAYIVLEKGQQKSLRTGKKGARREDFQGEKIVQEKWQFLYKTI